MMTLTQAKQTIRQMRAKLSTDPNEDLAALTWMHILWMDDAPEEMKMSYQLRKALARRLLASRLGLDKNGPIPNAWPGPTAHNLWASPASMPTQGDSTLEF